ncbi:hypothetical protein [Gymnodinialimonas sp.]
MTEPGGHKLYTTRTQAVHRAVACGLGVARSASAQAGDLFAQFQTRGLTPMAELRDWQMGTTTPEAVAQFCAIHGALGLEGVAPQTLQSTAWRAPRIEAQIDRVREPVGLRVLETVRES